MTNRQSMPMENNIEVTIRLDEDQLSYLTHILRRELYGESVVREEENYQEWENGADGAKTCQIIEELLERIETRTAAETA